MTKISFVGSFPLIKNDNVNTIAFVGRSNVGKSSFINFLAQKKIARCAKKPGATKLLNYYHAQIANKNDNYYLVDTPGYGYHVSQRIALQLLGVQVIKLVKRSKTRCIVWLVDSRRHMMKNDKILLPYLLATNTPILLIMSKCDKLNQHGLAMLKNACANYSWAQVIIYHSNISNKFQTRVKIEQFIESYLV